MNTVEIISNLVAGLDLAERLQSLIGGLRAQYDAAKAAGQVSAEQDAEVTATYEALRAKGFKFD